MKSKLSLLMIILMAFAAFTGCKTDTSQPEPKSTYTPIPDQPSQTVPSQTSPAPTAVQPAQPNRLLPGSRAPYLRPWIAAVIPKFRSTREAKKSGQRQTNSK